MAALSELRSSHSGPPTGNLPHETGGPDDALVRAAQLGDRSAFGLLYARYSRIVHGILLARIPFSDVDDLVQDVFLQALPRLNALRDLSRFPGWLPSNDQITLAKYNRFLGPILRVMIQKSTDPARSEQLDRYFQEASAKLYATSKN
jgi:hypothetical protein